MGRVSIKIDLSEDEEAHLQKYADHKGVSVSDVVREILFGRNAGCPGVGRSRTKRRVVKNTPGGKEK